MSRKSTKKPARLSITLVDPPHWRFRSMGFSTWVKQAESAPFHTENTPCPHCRGTYAVHNVLACRRAPRLRIQGVSQQSELAWYTTSGSRLTRPPPPSCRYLDLSHLPVPPTHSSTQLDSALCLLSSYYSFALILVTFPTISTETVLSKRAVYSDLLMNDRRLWNSSSIL
jgi:hypothetical protein